MHSSKLKQKVKEDYESISEEFSLSRSKAWKDFDLFLDYYKPGQRVLDLGCGNGRLYDYLKQRGPLNYTGVDQSEGLIRLAKEKLPEAKFVLADMTTYTNKYPFDLIFLVASFHHLPANEQVLALMNWRKMLKPGAKIIMLNWNLNQFRYWPQLCRSLFSSFGWRGLEINWGSKVQRYYYAFTLKILSNIFRRSAYTVLENRYVRNGHRADFLSGKNIFSVLQ